MVPQLVVCARYPRELRSAERATSPHWRWWFQSHSLRIDAQSLCAKRNEPRLPCRIFANGMIDNRNDKPPCPALRPGCHSFEQGARVWPATYGEHNTRWGIGQQMLIKLIPQLLHRASCLCLMSSGHGIEHPYSAEMNNPLAIGAARIY